MLNVVEAFTADDLYQYWPRVSSTTQRPNNDEHEQERYADIARITIREDAQGQNIVSYGVVRGLHTYERGY
jgi:hypothetical protein